MKIKDTDDLRKWLTLWTQKLDNRLATAQEAMAAAKLGEVLAPLLMGPHLAVEASVADARLRTPEDDQDDTVPDLPILGTEPPEDPDTPTPDRGANLGKGKGSVSFDVEVVRKGG